MMYRISNSIRSTHGQDGAIVLDIQQGLMFNVNLVGSKILELLQTGAGESEIVNAIRLEFKEDQGVVEQDVRAFIESLKQHKLLMSA